MELTSNIFFVPFPFNSRRTRTVLGAGDFAVSSAVVWNSLLADLRFLLRTAATFAKHLKLLFYRPD